MPSDLIDAKADGGGSGGRKADFHPDLATIRAMSTVLPGALPLAVNGVRVAASIRPRKFVIAGGDDTPVTMPRTAFQVVYPDCSVMLDSGLDKATHDSFSPDKPEPYYADEFATLQRALDQARLIGSPITTPTTWPGWSARRTFLRSRSRPSSAWTSRTA